MEQLYSAYIQIHGHALRPSDFGFTELEELLKTLDSHFKVLSLIYLLASFCIDIYLEFFTVYHNRIRKKKSSSIDNFFAK